MAPRTRPLIPNDVRPLHIQMAQLLAGAIADGAYSGGETLPGVRKLAEKYGVSDRVAHHAMDLLATRGLVAKGETTQRAIVTASRQEARAQRSQIAAMKDAATVAERLDALEARMDRVDELAAPLTVAGPDVASDDEVSELRRRLERAEAQIIDLYAKAGRPAAGMG